MKAHQTSPRTGEPEPRDGIAYAELLKIAHEEGLKSIATELLLQPSEDNGRRCIVKATVEIEKGRFEGLGDADPGNVEDFLAPHLIRVAETRAKARALRDAVNCGIVSFEELDGVRSGRDPASGLGASTPAARPNGSPAPRPRGNDQSSPPQATDGSEPMTESQRRYLFRILAGQGYRREAAEARLLGLFEADSLSEITKFRATRMIDHLLQTSAPAKADGGNGAAARHQR